MLTYFFKVTNILCKQHFERTDHVTLKTFMKRNTCLWRPPAESRHAVVAGVRRHQSQAPVFHDAQVEAYKENTVKEVKNDRIHTQCNVFFPEIIRFQWLCSSQDGRGAAALGGIEIRHSQEQSQIVRWFNTKTGPSKARDVVTPRGHWTTSGPLSRGCSH